MEDKVSEIGSHIFYEGRESFCIEGRYLTPAQLVFHHHFPEAYEQGVPVFSHCGFPQCLTPHHLHLSTLAQSYRREKHD